MCVCVPKKITPDNMCVTACADLNVSSIVCAVCLRESSTLQLILLTAAKIDDDDDDVIVVPDPDVLCQLKSARPRPYLAVVASVCVCHDN